MIYLPFEIVDIIADFHDFDKYCKPQQQKKLKNVNNDIISMNKVMRPIVPRLAKECWGQ